MGLGTWGKPGAVLFMPPYLAGTNIGLSPFVRTVCSVHHTCVELYTKC